MSSRNVLGQVFSNRRAAEPSATSKIVLGTLSQNPIPKSLSRKNLTKKSAPKAVKFIILVTKLLYCGMDAMEV